jgi:Transposase IS66 family
MWRPFNIVMRIVSSLIGIAMIFMGIVWILQGLNVAFRVGFMVGDIRWTIYGTILALVGPLIGALTDYVMGTYKLHADDIPIPVLAPGTGKTKSARLWA